MSFKQIQTNWKTIAGLLLALVFVLTFHGALPYLLMPTQGLAIWTTGFSQSFMNDSIYSIYAQNFGAPNPAPIMFGLSGAYPAALFLAVGLSPADAYSAMAAFWLVVSFFGAYRIARLLNLRALSAILCALLWMTLPIIWAHADYAMLSFGLALLPFYFWIGMRLFYGIPVSYFRFGLRAIIFSAACVVAVFMDGYSFVMFAVGYSLLIVYTYFWYCELQRHLFLFVLPLHIISFALAYGLYVAYVGVVQFDPAPLGSFRGYGVDLAFLVIPEKGFHWILDMLQLSQTRSIQYYFGEKLWTTTFSLPIILMGVVAWCKTNRKFRMAGGFLLIALFGVYMSLGPSLKINSVRSDVGQVNVFGLATSNMPEELTVASTGSAWISENIPGFKSMRASYRWLALGLFGLWLLIVLLAVNEDDIETNRRWVLWGVILVIALNLPNPKIRLYELAGYRNNIMEIEETLIKRFRTSLKARERVAFLPFGNDFLVNYIAARTNIRAYNTGGDKNLRAAMEQWPLTMRQFKIGRIDDYFPLKVQLLLARDEADVVVVPFFDMMRAVNGFPCETNSVSRASEGAVPNLIEGGYYCPPEIKQKLLPVLDNLENSPYIDVESGPFYATVRVKEKYLLRKRQIENLLINSYITYPIMFDSGIGQPFLILTAGWHEIEASSVWSSQSALLALPVPISCPKRDCTAVLKFSVFGASKSRPIPVKISTIDTAEFFSRSIIATAPGPYEVGVPMSVELATRRVSVEVSNAISPALLNGSHDARVLGISLSAIIFQ